MKKKVFKRQRRWVFMEEDYFVLNCPACWKRGMLSRNLFYTYMTKSKGVKYLYLVCKNCQATFKASIKDFQTGFREVSIWDAKEPISSEKKKEKCTHPYIMIGKEKDVCPICGKEIKPRSKRAKVMSKLFKSKQVKK